MADALPLAVLALVLVGAGTVAVAACCALIAAGRFLSRLLMPRPLPAPAAAPASPVPTGRVWLACHTPRCGHLQTVHHPAEGGLLRCDGCGHTRPQP